MPVCCTYKILQADLTDIALLEAILQIVVKVVIMDST